MNNREEETREFCEHWLVKAENYDPSQLQDAFDKFFTLFVALNRLYIYTAIIAKQPKAREWRKVQRIFPEIIGHETLWRALTSPPNDDLALLRNLIGPNGYFFLISGADADTPNQEANNDLHRRLGNQSACVAVEALLEYLYKVRCNMFHGTKGYHIEQLRLLDPCNRCLARIISTALHSLEDAPHL